MTSFRHRRTRGAAAAIAAVTLALAVPVGRVVAQTPAEQPPAAAQALPGTIPLFPLPDAVLFPNGARPLTIYEPRYRAMVADALKGDRIIGMVLLRRGYEADYEGRPPIHMVGCAGRIAEVEELPDGRYNIVLHGLTRFRILDEDQSRSYRLARVEAIPEAAAADASVLKADRDRLVALLSASGIEVTAPAVADEEVVDVMAQYMEMTAERRQELLEMDGAPRRARALIDLLIAR